MRVALCGAAYQNEHVVHASFTDRCGRATRSFDAQRIVCLEQWVFLVGRPHSATTWCQDASTLVAHTATVGMNSEHSQHLRRTTNICR